MQKNFFSISNALLNLILPKCALVYGESIVTIYLQIALYINNQDDCTDWRRNSCWMGDKKISQNTGYNKRVINNKIKILEKLHLLTINRRNGIKFYRLNNQFLNLNDILKFNNQLNTILCNEKNFSKEIENKIQQLDNLEKEILTDNFIIEDINFLRNKLLSAENVFKGSSLFYIKCILQDIGKNNLSNMSETERALRIGSSQSTLSRYIKKYKELNIIDTINNRGNKSSILSYNNIVLSVVRDVEMEKICPICKQEFNSEDELINHISNDNKDEKHVLLKYFKNKHKHQTYEQVFIENKSDILEYEKTEKVEIEEIEEIEIEKIEKIEEIEEIEEKIEIEESPKAKKTREKKSKIENFTDLNTENAPNLVNYFYEELYDGKIQSPFYPKEARQVKLLFKKYTPDEIKLTMRYLHRKGNIDLRFVNSSINEALFEDKCLKEIDIEGTEAFLVKLYYTGINQEINMQTFTHDIKKVKETINGIGYEKTKIVIEYMIKIDCLTFNFIGSKISEALKSINQGINPCLNEGSDREVMGIKSDLRDGNKIKSNDHIKIAREMFLNDDFNKKFDNFEWAYKIGLELDEELYNYGIKNKKLQSVFQIAANDLNKTNEVREKAKKLQIKYENWLFQFCEKCSK